MAIVQTTWGKALTAQEVVLDCEARLAAARARRDLLIRRLAREGRTQTEIAAELGMLRQTVAHILKATP
jgi:predicted transcriptional regulator